MTLHIGEPPEPAPGDRTGIAAHMGHVLCPACAAPFLTGAAFTADLMYRLHWREEQKRENPPQRQFVIGWIEGAR